MTKISELTTTISSTESEASKAKANREQGHKDFMGAEDELVHTVDTLGHDYELIKKEMSFVQGGKNATSLVQGGQNATKRFASREAAQALRARQEALVQLQRLAKMPVHEKRALTAYLQADPHYTLGNNVAEQTDDEIDRIFESDLRSGEPKEVSNLPTPPS